MSQETCPLLRVTLCRVTGPKAGPPGFVASCGDYPCGKFTGPWRATEREAEVDMARAYGRCRAWNAR